MGVSYTQQVRPLDILREPAFDPVRSLRVQTRPSAGEKQANFRPDSVHRGVYFAGVGKNWLLRKALKLSFSLYLEGAVP